MKKASPVFIAVIAFIAISGVLFAFHAKSKLETIRSLNAIISDMDFNSEFKGANSHENLDFLKGLFPQTGSTAAFIENTYLISSKYAIDDITFHSKDRTLIDIHTGTILKALPSSGIMPRVIHRDSVKINFTSDYRNIGEFIREIQNLRRLVTIEELKVRNQKRLLAVEMVVAVYSTEDTNAL